MLMEEVLGNTCWTSADAERACMLRGRPAICGSAFTGAISTIMLIILPILSRHSSRRIPATPPAWRRYRVVTGGFFHHSVTIQSTA